MAHSLPSGYRRGARTRRRPGAFALLPKRSQKNLRGNLAFTPFCSMGEGRSATTEIGRQLTVMTPPLALFHSWPLWDQAHHFDLGCTLDGVAADVAAPLGQRIPGIRLAGLWECDLADNSLTWSGEVYDIFGLPRGAAVTRDQAAALYCEQSRVAMERLRAHAIKHRRGFTIDVDLRPASGKARRMRLIGAPICTGDQVVRLHGLKLSL